MPGLLPYIRLGTRNRRTLVVAQSPNLLAVAPTEILLFTLKKPRRNYSESTGRSKKKSRASMKATIGNVESVG